MNTYTLIRMGLFFHLTGITMMVGTSIAGMSAHLRFRKFLMCEKEKALKLVVIGLIILNQLLFGVSLIRKLRRESGPAALMATTKKLTFKTFCKLADQQDDRSMGLMPVMSKFGILVRAGAGMIILTGIGLLILSKDIWQQSWFRLKLVLVIGLFLHGMLVNNEHGMKFRSLVAENDGVVTRHRI